jgi:hypothetical protein
MATIGRQTRLLRTSLQLTRRMCLRSCSVIIVSVSLLATTGCKQKGAVPEGGTHTASVVCTDCNTTSTLSLTKYPADDIWPKECAHCRKPAVYPYIMCSRCARPVPLKDARTGGYGYPRVCPHCGRKWEP